MNVATANEVVEKKDEMPMTAAVACAESQRVRGRKPTSHSSLQYNSKEDPSLSQKVTTIPYQIKIYLSDMSNTKEEKQ
jgi:hypothetical protein